MIHTQQHNLGKDCKLVLGSTRNAVVRASHSSTSQLDRPPHMHSPELACTNHHNRTCQPPALPTQQILQLHRPQKALENFRFGSEDTPVHALHAPRTDLQLCCTSALHRTHRSTTLGCDIQSVRTACTALELKRLCNASEIAGHPTMLALIDVGWAYMGGARSAMCSNSKAVRSGQQPTDKHDCATMGSMGGLATWSRHSSITRCTYHPQRSGGKDNTCSQDKTHSMPSASYEEARNHMQQCNHSLA